VQKFWKQCEKVVKHNYNIEYEMKKQEIRDEKLNQFVQKHLKLSNKLAESLKDKTLLANTPLIQQDAASLIKAPIIVETH
jgi:hypothetical protein